MPMIVGKHERTLAIDGPYIHVRIASPSPHNESALSDFACVDHADGEQGRQGSL